MIDLDDHDDPSALWGTVVALVGALLALAVAFGVDLSGDQTAAILAVATTAGPIVTALLIRRKAYAPATVDEIRAATFDAGYRAAEALEATDALEGEEVDDGSA